MPTIVIPLDTCLKCDSRRVEEGDTVKINLNPDAFDEEVIEDFSPVTGVVTEVRLPEPPESADAQMTIEVSVSSDDLPDGLLTLSTSQIESVSCYDCCASLTARVEVLEETATLNTSEGGFGTDDAGKVALFDADGRLRCSTGFSIVSTIAGENLSFTSEGGELGISAFRNPRGMTLNFPPSFGADRSIVLPDASGTVTLGDGSGITSPTAFRAALSVTDTALLALNRVLETEPLVTGLTGGGSTKLDGYATVALVAGTKRRVFVGNKEYIHELVAGTDAEASPAVIRPDDYNGVSNAKVWKRRPPFILSVDVTDSTYGGFGAADGEKLVKFFTDGSLSCTAVMAVNSTVGSYNTFIESLSTGSRIANTDNSLIEFLYFPATIANRTWTLPTTSAKYLAVATAATGIPTAVDINWSATNDAATAGDIGEFVQTLVAAGAPVALTTATPANVASVSLTAGDWDVEGWVNFSGNASTVTIRTAGISATSVTLPTDGSQAYNGHLTTTTSEITTVALPRKRVSIAATTTIYLVASSTFSAGSMGTFGGLNARRTR